MKNTTLKNIKLGAFVTVGIALFIVAIYLIGNEKNMFGDTFELNALFGNVNGLQSGNNVRFSGINVGTVEEVIITNDSTIEVRMIIESDVRKYIKKDAIASIGSDGLMGNMLVNISPGNGNRPPVENNDYILSYSRIKTDDILNTLSMTNENAALLVSDLLKITQNINEGKGTFGALLVDTVLTAALRQTILQLNNAAYNTEQISDNLIKTTEKLNEDEGLLGALIGDRGLTKKLDTIMENLTNTSDYLTATSSKLETFIDHLEDGEGVVSMVVHDTVFVNDLKQTVANINEGSARFNENMEALKHNFLFRRYFKRQAKKQNKKFK
ncbi:MAG: MlaD family protein [Cytophagales bacterium]|nr:MlaD family protein [Cytophagales bacterium]